MNDSARYPVADPGPSEVPAGFTGPTRVFDAPWGGFLATCGNGTERPEELTRDLGRPFRIMRSGIKPYAACRGLHSVLDVVLGMLAEHGFSGADVAAVEIGYCPCGQDARAPMDTPHKTSDRLSR